MTDREQRGKRSSLVSFSRKSRFPQLFSSDLAPLTEPTRVAGLQFRAGLVGSEVDNLAEGEALEKWKIEPVRLSRPIQVHLDNAEILRRDEVGHGEAG